MPRSKRRRQEPPANGLHDGPRITLPIPEELETFDVVSAEEVTEREYEWLSPGRFSLGAIWMLDGNKGTGKSTIAAAVAAMVAGGPPLPGGEQKYRGDVLWFAGEEPLSKVRQKVRAAGAPEGKLHFPGRGKDGSVKQQLAIAQHEDMLEGTARKYKAALIVLDTLACFTGGVDLNQEIPARSVMSPLTRVAQGTGCLILCLRHPRKAKTDDPLMRGQGNVAVAGAARGVLTTGKDPDSGRPVLGVIGTNDSRKPPVICYEIVDVDGTGALQWGAEIGLDPDRIEFGVVEEAQEMLRTEAKLLLRKRIGNDWVQASDVLAEAKKNGLSADQLDRARWKLGVRTRRKGKIGSDGHWEWGPPEKGWPKELQ